MKRRAAALLLSFLLAFWLSLPPRSGGGPGLFHRRGQLCPAAVGQHHALLERGVRLHRQLYFYRRGP